MFPMVHGILSRQGSPLVEEYLSAEEYAESWDDLSAWENHTNVQVSGNRLYSIGSGIPTIAYKNISVPSPGVLKIVGSIYAHSGGGYAFIGLAAVPGNPSVPWGEGEEAGENPFYVGIGIGSTDRKVSMYLGEGFSSPSVGVIQLGNASSSQLYHVTIYASDTEVSFALTSEDNDEEWTYVIPRSQFPNSGNITHLAVHNGSSSSTGKYVNPVAYKKSLTPLRVKSAGGVNIEGDVGQVVISGADGERWRASLPPDLDGESSAPVCVFMHQASTGDADSVWSESRALPVLQALLASGYIVVSADDGGDKWGNQESVENYSNLADWIMGKVYSQGVFAWGCSMGGMPMWNTIIQQHRNDIRAAVGICPVCDLDEMEADATFTSSVWAAYNAANHSEYLANSSGYNPVAEAPTGFEGVPLRFYVANLGTDGFVPRADHTDVLKPIVSVVTPESEIVTGGSGHLQPEQYDAAGIVAFFESYR